MDDYFGSINKEINKALEIANGARKKGYDPEDSVEILLAANMAERVVGLISSVAPQVKEAKIDRQIMELEKKYGFQDWRVAFDIALEVAQERFCKFKDKKEATEVGLRTGLAYLTNGVVASPLEGFTRLELKKTKKGKEYFALYFSGPIRSAGTTAVCAFVALADYVRKSLGYAEYDPREEEIKRMITELNDFHEKVTNLQYMPSEKEIEFMTKHLPVQICGEATEKFEVSNYKDLERVEANILSNGVCLVMGEGLTQKAAKFWSKFSKWCKEYKMNHWNFLEKFIKIQKKIRAKEETEKTEEKIAPDYGFIKDLVAGRPVFTYPLAKGGFRLRYGRCRNSGFSSQAISPITMMVVDNFIATGTQLKVERPGKATAISVCDSIEGPVVKLKNGEVIFLEDVAEAEKYLKEIEEILYLGDILINYGDFLDRGHILVPPGYCEEWWMLEAGSDKRNIDVNEAIRLCKEKKVPLHPRYTFHWKDISKEQFTSLINWLKKGQISERKIIVPFVYDINLQVSDKDPKRVLELVGVPHRVVAKENVIIEGEWAKAFLFSIGETKAFDFDINECEDVLSAVTKLSGAVIRDKSGTFIGARMGRPEKAKMRKMTGSPQALFPVGKEGGRLRCFQSALEKGKIKAQFPLWFCEKCNKETIYRVCCGERTKKRYYCGTCNSLLKEPCKNNDHKCTSYKNLSLDIKRYFEEALKTLGVKHYPELIKGVRGTSNEDHTPENLAKGILRAMNKLYVNKDGTIRYDMTEIPITHFKPIEIRTSIEKLRELGYEKDIRGEELHNPGQILELKPQDIILPACPESLDEKADDVLFNVSKFIDELLVKLYRTKIYYNLKDKNDLVGHLVIAISPHTSAGIVGRIIGFSKTQGLLAHPNFHSIMRRDCDGDEAGIMLMMDALLNFSKKYLPAHRGAKQDEPLVLTSKLIPSEVDNMVFNMDIAWKYPLEFYEAAMNYKYPWEINIKKYGDVLRTPGEYEGLGFTHDTGNINKGVRCSAYKSLPTMQEKVEGQMKIAEKIRAVDEMDVAKLVIERHFVRDIKGNLRKFSMQQFRCVECNEKYRRPPLKGVCLKCNGKLIFTIAEGSVVKYLAPSMSLAKKYKLPSYLQQTLMLTQQRIESVFGKEKEKQEGLGRWFG